MAQVDILVEGYVRRMADDLHVAGTVSLIRDGDAVVIVDPGLVPSPAEGFEVAPAITPMETPGHTVLAVAARIVPGHGVPFAPGPDTSR